MSRLLYTDPSAEEGLRRLTLDDPIGDVVAAASAVDASGQTTTLQLRRSDDRCVLELVQAADVKDVSGRPTRAFEALIGSEDIALPHSVQWLMEVFASAVPAAIVVPFADRSSAHRLVAAAFPLLRTLAEVPQLSDFAIPDEVPPALARVLACATAGQAVSCLAGTPVNNRRTSRALGAALVIDGRLRYREVSMLQGVGAALTSDHIATSLELEAAGADTVVPASLATSAHTALASTGSVRRHHQFLHALLTDIDGVGVMRLLGAAQVTGSVVLTGVQPSDVGHVRERAQEALADPGFGSTAVEALHGQPTGNPGQRFRVAGRHSKGELVAAGRGMQNCLGSMRVGQGDVIVLVIDQDGRYRHAIQVGNGGVRQWLGPHNHAPAKADCPQITKRLREAGVSVSDPASRRRPAHHLRGEGDPF